MGVSLQMASRLVQPFFAGFTNTERVNYTQTHRPNYVKTYIYIRQVNGVKLGGYTIFAFVCLSVCLYVRTQSHWFEWAE